VQDEVIVFGKSWANFVTVVKVRPTVCDRNVVKESSFRQYMIQGDVRSDY